MSVRLPLSPQQSRVFRLSEDNVATYLASAVFAIPEDLTFEHVQEAVRATVRRHEVLRAEVLVDGTEGAYQRVCEDIPVTVRRVGSEASTCADLLLRMIEDSRLSRVAKPSLDVTWAEDARHGKLVGLHLSAWYGDHASLIRLARELGDRCHGEALQSDPVQYPELVDWQHQLLTSPDTAEGRTWWKPLDGEDLDASRPDWHGTRPSGQRRIRVFRECLNECLMGDLERVAEGCGASARDWTLATWDLLLARHSGREQVVIGVLVDGRVYGELDDVIGPLAKYVPLRLPASDRIAFGARAGQTGTMVREMVRWQHYLDLERIAPAGPVTPYLPVQYEFFDPRTSAMSGWTLLRLRSRIDRFDLKLTIERSPRGDALELHYDADAIPDEEVASLARRYQELLAASLAEPFKPCGHHDALTAAERRSLFPPTAITERPNCCLHELLAEAVARHPHDPALITPEGIVSFTMLDRQANGIARRLMESGVALEEPVAVFVERSPELIASMLGILKAGSAYVPLDPETPPARLAAQLLAAGARHAVTTPDLRDRLPASLECVVAVGEEAAMTARAPAPSADNLAYVILTSGTTGVPKPVMISHRAAVNYLLWCREAYASERGRGAPLFGSIAFDLTVTSVFLPLIEGQPLTLVQPGEEMRRLAGLLRHNGFRWLKLTPSHLRMLAELLPTEKLAGAVAVVILGGETLRRDDVLAHLGAGPTIVNEYGPTETTVGCSAHTICASTLDSETVPIGRPIANSRLYVLDSEGRPRPPGTVGEIFIGGLGVARGYAGQPSLTAASFVPDPFASQPGARMYRTGDLARIRSGGAIEILGRADGQVKIRGHRVELGEVESALGAFRRSGKRPSSRWPTHAATTGWLPSSSPARGCPSKTFPVAWLPSCRTSCSPQTTGWCRRSLWLLRARSIDPVSGRRRWSPARTAVPRHPPNRRCTTSGVMYSARHRYPWKPTSTPWAATPSTASK